MWVVRVGDDLYVRSAGGPGRPWYRNALASGAGRIRAAGIERHQLAIEHHAVHGLFSELGLKAREFVHREPAARPVDALLATSCSPAVLLGDRPRLE